MGFYGTLKLIFFKVSIDDRIDQLTPAAGVGLVLVLVLVRDDEAFLRWTPLRRVRAPAPHCRSLVIR